MKRRAYDEWAPKAFLTALGQEADKLLVVFLQASQEMEAAYTTAQRERARRFGPSAGEEFATRTNFLPVFEKVLAPFFAKHHFSGPQAERAINAFALHAQRNPVDFVTFIHQVKSPKISRPDARLDNLHVVWTFGAAQRSGMIMTDHRHSWFKTEKGIVSTEPGDLLAALLFVKV